MTTRPAELQPCVVKGCAWRGADPYACPWHSGDYDAAWDRQGELMQGIPSLRKTRHRR